MDGIVVKLPVERQFKSRVPHRRGGGARDLQGQGIAFSSRVVSCRTL